jgi:hypothetical protein
MDRLYRNYFVVAVAGMFCLLNANIVSAQTATNLKCFWCVGPGEVGFNAVGWSSLSPLLRQGLTADANDVAALEARVAALEALVATLQASSVPNLGTYLRIGTHNGQPAVLFEAVNVMVVNGTGSTAGATNGLGNLIVGYDEFGGNPRDNKSGSHNFVVGTEHSYGSLGGFVAGRDNTVSREYASVSGGDGNTASGRSSSVSGGDANTASGDSSSVSGGRSNTASGSRSSVSGGDFNAASGGSSSVSGGRTRVASGTTNWVAGGLLEED